MMNTFVAKMDGEDTALVMVEFEDGSIGQIFTGEGFIFPANDAKFHFVGSQGEVYGDRVTAHIKPRGFDDGVIGHGEELHRRSRHLTTRSPTSSTPIATEAQARSRTSTTVAGCWKSSRAAYKSVETGTTVSVAAQTR